VCRSGESTARQIAQDGQWKYSIPQMPCLVYEWVWFWGQEAICSSHFNKFKSSLVQEFKLFQEFSEILDFGVPRSLLRDWL